MDESRLAGRLVAAVFGLPGLIAPVLALLDRDRASWAFGIAIPLVALAVWFAARRFGARLPGLFIVLSTVGLVILWPETGLRVAGYRFHTAGVIQFGYPDATEMIHLEQDPELFWRLPSSIPFLNEHGFLGPAPEEPKGEGIFRIFFFGDSCTQQGHPKGFPELAADLLNQFGKDARRAESVNFGVTGYSSYQGRKLASRFTPRFEPDVAVIYFGWNDHWQAYGVTDEERGARSRSQGADRLEFVMRSSRFLQWIVEAAGRSAGRPLGKPRVSTEEYRANLEQIGETVEGAGGKVVLVTAPSAHPRLGAPAYVVERGLAASKQDAIELHERYAGVVRRLATERGWILVDLAAAVEAEPDVESLFMEDGIHFTPDGLRWVAVRIARSIDEYGG